MDEYGRNYFQQPYQDPAGLKYRIEGDDVIKGVTTILRGGIVKDEKTGREVWNETYRLLNEEGVSRVELFLRGGLNKINHLTKYKNEHRILQQMRSMIRAFTIELVLYAKAWAPEAKMVGGELVNDDIKKVRNKHLVLQVVENAIFQSMQRGEQGFEAENTIKSWNVNELVGRPPSEDAPRRQGWFGGLFGRREA